MKIEEKLALNKYEQSGEAHITINKESCDHCNLNPCLYACPAECFILREDHITFSHDGCLECGSCRIVCPKDAIQWAYSKGGFGICYQYG